MWGEEALTYAWGSGKKKQPGKRNEWGEEATGRRVDKVFARLAAMSQRLFSPHRPTREQLISK
jgi:hypothetical protein